jgi:hypothetical protein
VLATRYTLDVQNETLMAGNQKLSNQHPYEPFYVAYDQGLNRLYLSYGCSIAVLNPSTLSPIGPLNASAGCGVIYLPTTGDLYLSGYSHLIVVNPANDTIVQRIYASEAGQTTYGLFVYDARANAILVGNAFNTTANVVNLTLGRVVANISTGTYVADGAYDPVNSNVYLADYENNTVIVVNSSTWSLHYLKLPSNLYGFLEGVAVDTQTGNVYATSVFYCPSCYGYDDVVELSGHNGSVLAVAGIGAFTTGMAYDSETDRLFVADSRVGRVYVLYPSNLSLNATIVTDTPVLGLWGPWWLTYVPQLNTIYAPTSYQDSLLAISDISLSIYLRWGGFAQPYAETWDSGCDCLVVGDWWEDQLYFVNGTTYQISRTVPLGGTVRGITYDSATNELWVGMGDLWGSSGIAILNASNGNLVTTLTSGSWFNAPAFDSADQRMYAPSVLSNVVDIYNSTNLTYLGQINASYATNAVWDPANDRVFVSDWEANNVTVINGSSGGLVTTILNVSGPDPIVFDPSTALVYTGDENSPNITVINPVKDTEVGNISDPTYSAGLAVSPSGGELFATGDSANLSEVNLTTNLSITIPAGTETAGLAWLPDGVLAATDLTGGVYLLSVGGPYPLTTPLLELRPSFVLQGEPLNVSTNETGGSGGYTYSYSGLPGGCSSVNSARFECVPTTPGQFEVEVAVNDSRGETANGSAFLWIATGYVVTFTATGLPGGQEWWVSLTDGQSFDSTGTTITFSEPNGSYTYRVTAENRTHSAPGGSFTVDGTPVSESVTFSLVAYTVTFRESGLLSGTEWWVNLTNGQSFAGTGSTVSFPEANGTYIYELATVENRYSTSGGAFTVDGAPATESVSFSLVVYSVTFSESGLPSGIGWWVNLTDGQSFARSGSTVSFSEPNGTYSYSLPTADKTYRAAGGTFTVSGASKSVMVTFNLLTNTVTLTESGLPTGTEWWVNLTNGQSLNGTGGTISFQEPNGSYIYAIASADKTYEAIGGPLIVNGVTVSISVALSRVTYTLTFTESGLPTGFDWWVNLTNDRNLSSTATTLSFSEPNGTYSYTIGAVSGYSCNATSGHATVKGSSRTISVTFIPTGSSGGGSSSLGGLSTMDWIGIGVVIAAVAGIGAAFALRRKRRGGTKALPSPGATPPIQPPGQT